MVYVPGMPIKLEKQKNTLAQSSKKIKTKNLKLKSCFWRILRVQTKRAICKLHGTHWKLTRGHLGWTVSVGCPETLQSSAYSSLSSGAGSGPHPQECLEQSFALSDTGCLFLVFWRHVRGQRWKQSKTKKGVRTQSKSVIIPLYFCPWPNVCQMRDRI